MPESDGKAGCNRLAGRRIIITGAASGIAKAMAELFHREGAPARVADRIVVPPDALVTGGDGHSAAIGRLSLQLIGGLA